MVKIKYVVVDNDGDINESLKYVREYGGGGGGKWYTRIKHFCDYKWLKKKSLTGTWLQTYRCICVVNAQSFKDNLLFPWANSLT